MERLRLLRRDMKTLLLWLAIAGAAAAHGSVSANAAYPQTPGSYLIVAVPANYKTDPTSQSLINGFKTDPTLLQLRARTHYWTYTENSPDWKYRWANRVDKLPAVIVIDNGMVRYKRSGVDANTISYECRAGGLLDRLIRPVVRPNTCPGPNCPISPYRPYDPPNEPVDAPPEDGGLHPVDPIPDTPLTPPQAPQVDESAALRLEIAALEARIKVLEQGQFLKPGDLSGLDNRLQTLEAKPTESGLNLAQRIDVAALTARLPAFTVLFEGGDAPKTQEVRLDGELRIPPLRAEWTRLDGEKIEQSRSLYDKLKFRTDKPMEVGG